MDGKQSGHNDISPTKFNSIHHKVVINTNRVERIDSTDYNTSCNCEMGWDGGGDGVDIGDDVDDDLDDACDDDDDDGDDLPGGICPPEMDFSSSLVSATRRRRNSETLLFLGFLPQGVI